MRVLEWSQKNSHCKFMQNFYNIKGQLTQQSEVSSTLSSNSSKFYGCPCYENEEDPIKNEGARVVTTSSITF